MVDGVQSKTNQCGTADYKGLEVCCRVCWRQRNAPNHRQWCVTLSLTHPTLQANRYSQIDIDERVKSKGHFSTDLCLKSGSDATSTLNQPPPFRYSVSNCGK